MDEFYSGYFYGSGCNGAVVSAAENVVDVNSDDVLIIDGMTKRFRLPGWVHIISSISIAELTLISAWPGYWVQRSLSKLFLPAGVI